MFDIHQRWISLRCGGHCATVSTVLLRMLKEKLLKCNYVIDLKDILEDKNFLPRHSNENVVMHRTEGECDSSFLYSLLLLESSRERAREKNTKLITFQATSYLYRCSSKAEEIRLSTDKSLIEWLRASTRGEERSTGVSQWRVRSRYPQKK